MLRFIVYAVPLLILLLALFGFTVELLDAEPRSGSVIRLALFEQPRVPGQLVIGAWLVEASGLIALFLLAQGRFGSWWLDGLVAGWVAWVFRGPLLVITIVVAAQQPQDPWWQLAFGWWVLYSVCGLSLAILARRSGLEPWAPAAGKAEVEPEALATALSESEREPAIAKQEAREPKAASAEPADEPPAIDAAPDDVEPGRVEPGKVEPAPTEDGQTEEKIESAELRASDPAEIIVAEMPRSPASGGTAAAGTDAAKE